MRNLRLTFAFIFFVLFSVGNTNIAKADTASSGGSYSSSDCMAGLINLSLCINVEIGDVNVLNGITVQDLVNIYDINVTDLIRAEDILSDNDIDILNIELGSITIDDVLTDVLRDANIISGNKVVVGIVNKQFVVKECKKLVKSCL